MSFPDRDQRFGHPTTWPGAHQAPSPRPSARKSRAPIVALAVAVALALMAGTGGVVWWLAGRGSDPLVVAAASPTPTASPTATNSLRPAPSPAQWDERTTCNALVPLLDKTADLVLAYAKGEPWVRADAEGLRDKLMVLYRSAPTSMRDDIGSQATTVSTILDGGRYDRDYVVNSGVRLAEGCRKYAS